MTGFDSLNNDIVAGMEGRRGGIPMTFHRLNKYIGIRKSMYFLIGGLTGSGKTSFVDESFILSPYEWSISKENKTNTKLKIIYRSMERSKSYKLAKWVSRKIFLDQGVIIPISKLLGWYTNNLLTKDEHDLFLMYKDYIDGLEETVTIISGPENPVGVAKDLRKYALTKGIIEDVDEYNKVYIPNDENEITIVVIDHIGLLKTTKDLNTKKDAIDKLSSEFQFARDFFGYTPVVVSQFNRSISNPIRLKAGDVEPQLEDFSDSSQTQNDADVVLTLFDAMRYKVDDPSGYDLNKLIDESGANYFRSLRLIKNSYGADSLRIGLAFLGELGMFAELPKRKDITDSDYEAVRNKSYFLK